MTFRCHLCHRDFAFESESYPYVRSRILLHMSECEGAAALSKEERSAVAWQAADNAFFFRDLRP